MATNDRNMEDVISRLPGDISFLIESVQSERKAYETLERTIALVDDRMTELFTKQSVDIEKQNKTIEKQNKTIEEQNKTIGELKEKIDRQDKKIANLQGQRQGFRNAIITNLQNNQFEDILKFLESNGQIWGYELNGEAIWDILISGGSQGSSLQGETISRCLLDSDGDLNTIRKYEQLFVTLLDKYGHLKHTFEKKMNDMLISIKNFTPSQRINIALLTGLCIANGSIPPSILQKLISGCLIEDDMAINFLVEVCVTFKIQTSSASLVEALKKGGISRKLSAFVPANNQKNKIIHLLFNKAGLEEVSQLYERSNAILVLCEVFLKGVQDQIRLSKIIENISRIAIKKNIPNTDIMDALLSTISMFGMVGQLIQLREVFKAFTVADCDKMKLILSVQKLCLENPDLMVLFPQIIKMFYEGEIVSLAVVHAWMDEESSKNGHSFFLEQVKALFPSVSA